MPRRFASFLPSLVLALALVTFATGCADIRGSLPSFMEVEYPDRTSLPEDWRPAGPAAARLDDSAWTPEEEKASRAAALGGVREMARYFDAHPAAAAELGDNAIECFLNATYAAAPTPALRDLAEAEASERLDEALRAGHTAAPTPDDWSTLIVLAAYAHRLYGPNDGRTREIIARANTARPAASKLGDLFGVDWRATLRAEPVGNEDAYALLIWLVVILDARTVPGLDLPADSADFAAAVWPMLRDYDFVEARERGDDFNDNAVYDDGYLATHIGYVPTGYGRHALRIGDSPNLYRYLRRNFYAVLALGELDLVAEFVDLLRQYGATPENDLQVRHGVRHLMRLYRSAGGWIKHRESYEDPASNPYDLIHKPWTAVSGVRPRRPEYRGPESYRAGFEDWCLLPR